MATGPKIVHKQFNSPIGLYSQNNIQETLNKHLQNLDNGTVGIDFNNPATGKPGNLANSAVLRMLEEEERNRKGYPKLDPTQVQAILETMVHMNHRFDSCWPPEQYKDQSRRCWDGQLNATGQIHSEFLKATKGKKKVVWPPVPETNGYHSQQQLSPAYAPAQQYEAPQQEYQQYPQSQAPQHQSYPQSQQYLPQSQPQQQYSPQYQTPKSQPAFCEGKRQAPTGLSKLIPVGPGVTASPVSPPQRTTPSLVPAPLSPQPYKQQSNRWAPVAAPLSPQGYGSQPSYPSSTPQYSAPYDYPQKHVEPPATTITLRQSQPVHQQPPPVFASQPAAASYRGGPNMRGDMKWPPQSVKEAVAAENEARRQLAKGPACRPRKVKKDYSTFFAQHALSHNYPGYRAPPGTQHYEEHPGRSSY